MIEIFYALDGLAYQLLRQAYLSPAEKLNIGLMYTSPQGPGSLSPLRG